MKVRDQLEYFARLHGLSVERAREATAYWLERLGVAERAGDRVEALSLGNQGVVDVARTAGRMKHFSAEEPSLAELFREAVGA